LAAVFYFLHIRLFVIIILSIAIDLKLKHKQSAIFLYNKLALLLNFKVNQNFGTFQENDISFICCVQPFSNNLSSMSTEMSHFLKETQFPRSSEQSRIRRERDRDLQTIEFKLWTLLKWQNRSSPLLLFTIRKAFFLFLYFLDILLYWYVDEYGKS